ncbi:sensor histidine kinase [Nocardioides sp.]|uniref:sensor histidine kinase n=1 Tax=Nocardioides sp. TaxID=35761 RepID=UPI00261601F5|nr:sensor histidine kinase [Nocardioides sp.]
MSVDVSDRLPSRIALLGRLIALLALGAPVLWARDMAGIFTLIATFAVWVVITGLEIRGRLPLLATMCIDAVLIALIAGVILNTAPIALGALAVPPFTTALRRGAWGVTVVLACEVVTLSLTIALFTSDFTAQEGYTTFSCLVVGLGLGMIGSFIHAVLHEHQTELAPYLYAQDLLHELIDISDGLDSGLNPVALGGQLLWALREKLPCTATALFVHRGDGLTPLVAKSMENDLSDLEAVAVTAYERRAVVRRFPRIALPLESGSGVTAILAAELTPGAEGAALTTNHRLEALLREHRPAIVHLDTALLFASFRDRASAEERRRLAREMHDGVAQDIASLGYLVDAIGVDATGEKQAERIAILRDRISGIVAEIRRSLVNLRTDIGESESLGAAIASIARSQADASGVAIHVTTDETTGRLRPDVEAELFRIVQESLNNALKHAGATTISVHCQVRAPEATITVTDDGRGMGTPRADSHGLKIMRERAALINATLDFSTTPSGGVEVSVTIRDPENRPSEVTVIGSPFHTDTRVGA